MADAQAMWTYVQNFEMGPVLAPADALFESRAGMTRATALEQQPLGGDWVDTWLAALGEAVVTHQSAYYNALTGVSLGMPGDHTRRTVEAYGPVGIDEAGWSQLQNAVLNLSSQVSASVGAWQFVHARTMLGELWQAMATMYAYSTDNNSEFPFPGDWQDLRPLLQ